MGKGPLLALVAFTGVALFLMTQSSGGSSGGSTFTYKGFPVTLAPGSLGMVSASWRYKGPSGDVHTASVSGDNDVDVTSEAIDTIEGLIALGAVPA